MPAPTLPRFGALRFVQYCARVPISIIQLDSRVPPGQLTDLFPSARLVRFDDGDRLPAVSELTGLVVLGGRQNAYDHGLEPVSELLRSATAAGVPTLGICLGAQLLAVSHGGRVEVSAPAGPERGIISVRTRPGAQDDPVLGAVVEKFGRDFPAVSMHDDAVTELPEGATWLAASQQYPYQAFRVGSALGVQFHPEVDAATYAEWLNRENGVELPVAEAQWREQAEDLTRLAAALSEGMVSGGMVSGGIAGGAANGNRD